MAKKYVFSQNSLKYLLTKIFTYIKNKNTASAVTVTTTVEIKENTNYTIPVYYIPGSNNLEIYYMGENLVKNIHYIEVSTSSKKSNIIQFKDWGQNVPIGRTIKFVVKGDN